MTRASPWTDRDRAQLLVRVSALYFLEGRTQLDIAERLRLSRPQVARLLRAARHAGIARIVVRPPTAALTTLEAELEGRFGLREVRIVALATDDSPALACRLIGVAAAADFARSVRAGHAVGLVGGELVASMIGAAEPMNASAVRVVQAVGPELASESHVDDALRALAAIDALYLEVTPDACSTGRVLGIPVEQMRRARHVVALAHGAARAQAVAAALRTRLVRALITDEITARAVAALPRVEADAIATTRSQRGPNLSHHDLRPARPHRPTPHGDSPRERWIQ